MYGDSLSKELAAFSASQREKRAVPRQRVVEQKLGAPHREDQTTNRMADRLQTYRPVAAWPARCNRNADRHLFAQI